MAKGKKYPNWKEKVVEWETRNKSTKAWCQENKIPYTTLCGWRDRLKKIHKNNTSDEMKEGFIELQEQTPSDSGIVLEFNGAKIHLKSSFDAIVLKQCLDCLRGATC